jgi:hypothetical protein
MATIIRRPGKNGQTSYRAQVRRKGAPPLSAAFTKLSAARKWVQVTEAAIVEGRHFRTAEAKGHTLAETIDRYLLDVLPHKSASSIYMRTLQLQWWRGRLGHCILAELTPALRGCPETNQQCHASIKQHSRGNERQDVHMG